MKAVYIAHPLTTHGTVSENIAKVTAICQELSRQRKVIPLSPIHAFGHLDPSGSQDVAMWHCIELLKRSDELWL